MCRFCISASFTFKTNAADLTSEIVQLFHTATKDRITDDPYNG